MPRALNLPSTTTQIRHAHDLHYQTCPPSEMLRALPLARLRIILFPRETCLLPGVEDGLDEVEAEGAVEVFGEGLVRAGCLCIFLLRGVSVLV